MQLVAWKYFSVVMTLLLVLGLGAGVLTSGPVKAEAPPPQQWVQRYGVGSGDSQAAAIAVDGSGNAYVTGSSANGTDFDCVTIKYSPSGAELWVARYNGGFGQDGASAIAVDSSGNAYITGFRYNGTDDDYLTIKYRSSDGNEEWARLYDGGVGDDRASAIAVDGGGNAYVTGYNSTAGNDVYMTIKYNTTGVQQWFTPYAGGSGNQATAIAVDGSGNAYVTGYSNTGAGKRDYATVKYSTGGVEQWVARYVDSTSKASATAIALDGSGNAYVTGYHRGAASNINYATVKYRSSDGNQEWASVYDGGFGTDEANAIAVDGSGNAYVTGKSRGAGGDDYATVKYSTGGVEQWVSRYDGGFGNDEARAIAVDGSGNAYVTGYVWGSGGNADCATIKYNSAGVDLWVMLYNGPDNDNDWATAIALGSIYITGVSTNASDTDEYLTIKYLQEAAAQPTIAAVSPADGLQGLCPLPVIIMGTNLNGATAVDFGAGITVISFTVNSDTQITANICIAGDAAAGPHDVSVTTPGGTATLTGDGFTVDSLAQFAGALTSHGGSTSGTTTTPTISLPVIQTQSASLSARTVTPGTPVIVTADIANKSAVNGSKKITLYVNGQVESTQAVTVGSGGFTKLTFNVSRSEPGDYIVYVDGVPAGSFKVEMVTGNDGILIFSATLLAAVLVLGLVILRRRQHAG